VTLPQIQSVPENYPPPGNTPPGGRDARVSIVVVGGLDPGGGAGLLRDVATATARGAQVTAVGTAWTQQGAGVHRVEPREPAAVGAALAHALGAVGPAAVKIGMAVGPATAAELVKALLGFAGAVVVDPLLSSTRGDRSGTGRRPSYSLCSGGPRWSRPTPRRPGPSAANRSKHPTMPPRLGAISSRSKA